ncbi:sensor histidine kinase [Phenylobacterium sp.]|uniref:sensor histidine kinase n=1 Tax=Phenylobacterium sp. TaxID=1871053 RepID=UPI003FA702A6
MDNAVRYSGPCGQVTLTARRTPEGAQIIVEDGGPGVPVAEREAVFKRFARLTRDADNPGSGLSLAEAWLQSQSPGRHRPIAQMQRAPAGDERISRGWIRDGLQRPALQVDEGPA